MPNYLANTDLATLRADLARLESAPVHLLPWRALERGLRDSLIEAYTAEIEARGESVENWDLPACTPYPFNDF